MTNEQARAEFAKQAHKNEWRVCHCSACVAKREQDRGVPAEDIWVAMWNEYLPGV